MIIKRFEDVVGWQKARVLTKAVYDCSKAGGFGKDFNLRNQIRSASVSIMSNIAEGFERGGNKEFLQFLSVAKGSCGEVHPERKELERIHIACVPLYLNPPNFGRPAF